MTKWTRAIFCIAAFLTVATTGHAASQALIVRDLKGGYISPAQGVAQTEKALAIYRQLFQ